MILSSRTFALLALAVNILVIGATAVVIASVSTPADVLVFYRTALAALVMAIPFSQQVRKAPIHDRRAWGLGILGGILFALNSYLWSLGIQAGGPTIPTLIANTSPVWVSLGALLLFKERLSPIFFGGLFLALLGAIIILLSGADQTYTANLGIAYGFGSSLFFGAYILVSQLARVSLSAIAYFWISTSASALVMLLIVLANHSQLTGFDLQTWLMLLFLGLVTQVVGFMAISFAMGHLPGSLISPSMLLQLVVTAFLGWFFLGETVSAIQLIAALALVAGVWLIIRANRGT